MGKHDEALGQIHESLSLTTRHLAEAAATLAASAVPAMGIPMAGVPAIGVPVAGVPPQTVAGAPPATLAAPPVAHVAVPPGFPPAEARAGPVAGDPLAFLVSGVHAATLLSSNAAVVARSAPVVAAAVPAIGKVIGR